MAGWKRTARGGVPGSGADDLLCRESISEKGLVLRRPDIFGVKF
ncbi:hypothetical protein [[Clostridium] scindens]|nr:hypothetical protein [[Clostridium] scindens]